MSADTPKDTPTQHGAPPPDAPSLSLVLTSRGDAAAPRARLDELLPDCAAGGVEVVVVRRGPAEEALALVREYPSVRFVRPPEGAPADALRPTGMAAASGDVVLLAEDDDRDALARLRHLLGLYGLPRAGAAPEAPETRPAEAGPAAGPDDPAPRQGEPPNDAAEGSTWHPRSRQDGGWTGSPRATGSSSSVPAPAA